MLKFGGTVYYHKETASANDGRLERKCTVLLELHSVSMKQVK